MKCLNCGRKKDRLFGIYCQSCMDASKRLEAILEKGLEIEYVDGSKITYYKDEDSKNKAIKRMSGAEQETPSKG